MVDIIEASLQLNTGTVTTLSFLMVQSSLAFQFRAQLPYYVGSSKETSGLEDRRRHP